jgi:hypothetical protein
MNDRDSAYSDDVFKRMALLTDCAGIDAEKAGAINADALDWLADVVKQAKATKLETMKSVVCPECAKAFKVEILDLEKATKAAGNLVKVLDINARLTQFIQGKEDSRPGHGGGKGNDWLQCLKPEQLAMVQGWIVENQAVQG